MIERGWPQIARDGRASGYVQEQDVQKFAQ
jgi:hypothetical protein